MTSRRAQSLVKWILLAIVLVAGVAGVLYALRLARPAVTVTEVVVGPAVQAFYATGTLEPADREHPIRAPVEGFIHAPPGDQPYIDKGDRVRKGQVLAVVYNEQFQYAYDKALADLTEKQARADAKSSPVLLELDAKIANYGELVQAAEREFRRYSISIEANVVAQADYDRALDRLKTVNAEFESFKAQKLQSRLLLDRELAEAESALKVATWNLEQTKLVSPVDGYVMDKPQQVGSRIAVNDPVVTVANTAPENLVMRAQVDEEDVTKVALPSQVMEAATTPANGPSTGPSTGPATAAPPAAPPATGRGTSPATSPVGQLVRMSLYAFPDQIFAGRVVRIYPKADVERRTFEVDIAIEQPNGRMQAGMTGELAFEIQSKAQTLVAPSQALQDGKVWTIRDGRLTDAQAKVGLRGVERIEILSGLQAGDVVVLSPVAELEPNVPVRVAERLDPRVAAGLNKPKEKEIFRGGF